MNLSGANIFADDVDYGIYTMNSAEAGQYCVILPKNSNSKMNMLVDLHMKSSFDGVGNNTVNKDTLIGDLKKEYGDVNAKYPNSIMVFPMLDNGMLANSVASGDKQKMFDEVKKIGAITSEIYKKLTESGVDKNNIDQKIVVVKKDDNDNKFVDWLKEQMPNFVDGMDFNTPSVSESNNLFGPVNSEGSIPEVAPVAEPKVEEPVSEVTPVVEEKQEPEVKAEESVVSNDIFATPALEPVVEEPVPEVAPAKEEVAPVVEEKQAPEVKTEEPVAPTNVSTDEPKPTVAAELNGTTTFSPIVNNDVTNEAPVLESGPVLARKRSGGFANLLIILVILVGVTIASIELGKFLFSVYGAK